MSQTLSPNTQAILLLTAPLLVGRNVSAAELLSPGEYNRLVRRLRDLQHQPSDLLAAGATELLRACQPVIDEGRLQRLLGRGFLLSQAVERWQARAMWVVSRADSDYPRRLKTRLKEDAPAVLYGCGELPILETGGLAVVGSRHVDEKLIEYTLAIGQLSAKAHKTIVSGGAKGIDQAAMRGALEAGGQGSGVLADSLEKTIMRREHRKLLMDGQLVLISPYDPSAGFNVGHAMQRNKLIYALADATLVVNADYNKGGTWAGAVEQLDKLRLVPVYVRSTGEMGSGLEALRHKGALPWPNPQDPDDFAQVFEVTSAGATEAPRQPGLSADQQFALSAPANDQPRMQAESENPVANCAKSELSLPASSAEILFAKVRELLLQDLTTLKTDAEVAADLNVSKSQAREWLQRLVEEGLIEKGHKPVKYRANVQRSFLE